MAKLSKIDLKKRKNEHRTTKFCHREQGEKKN